MRSRVRCSLLALPIGALLAVLAPAAAQASFGLEHFFAANCGAGFEKCGEAGAELKAGEAFTQAAGHPNYGITDFKLNRKEAAPGLFLPEGDLKNLRVDVAPGVSTNPQAVAKCSVAEFTGTLLEPAKHIYSAPTCAETGPEDSVIGENKVTTVLEVSAGVFADVPLTGKVYNLEQPNGDSSYFGVALPVGAGLYVHTFIEGHVEFATDYHDYFEIKNITEGLLESRLIFKGDIGTGGFLTNPSTCSGIGPQTTTSIHLESYAGESRPGAYEAPVGTEGCASIVPFAPTFALKAGNTQQDEADGLTAELGLPHNPNPAELDSSQLKTASVTLPEGLTLNPSAAKELEACTKEKFKIGTTTLGFGCPEKSKIGTVVLDVPGLPAGSLTGSIYLGSAEGKPITAPPYTMYVDAESARYGLAVRLEGLVEPNPATGRLTATFSKNPEQPFTSIAMTFKGGAQAPLANPLTCGTATVTTALTPFTGTAAQDPASSFAVDSNDAGGSCASPVAFAPTQSTPPPAEPLTAGGHTAYTFTLERGQGQQYLSQVRTVLPAGLVGAIPAVPLCSAAELAALSCSSASQIGSVSVLAGSGSEPYPLSGSVYLTGPYNGAPYGLFISVPVIAGPFNLGNAITRLGISVEQTTGRVVVSGYLPTIVYGGIPVRMRKATMSITRQGFLSNPTSCGMLATESTITGTLGASVNLSTPFQAVNCGALAFKPAFGAASSARTSKANGASLETTINMPAGDANVKSVVVQLPKQLPSRLTTLQKACPEATFAANPLDCPSGSLVGGVRANTPVLPNKMTGPAYLVSHGGAAFPDLDLVLQADGVRVILVGNTNIKNGITTTTFASTPDVPVSSITVNLPLGAHSALAAYGEFCAQPLVMPTTITAQNGVVFKQNTIIKVKECGVKIVGHKAIGNTAYLTVRTPEAGRISGSGSNLATVYRQLGKAQKATTLKVALSRGGQSKRKPLKVRLRVGFLPKKKGAPASASFVTVTFG
jgi:hypothetical protein